MARTEVNRTRETQEASGTSYDHLVPAYWIGHNVELGGGPWGESLEKHAEEYLSDYSLDKREKIVSYLERRRKILIGLMEDYREKLESLGEEQTLSVKDFLEAKAEEAKGDSPVRRAVEGQEPMFMEVTEAKLHQVPKEMMIDKVKEIAKKADWDRIPVVQ